MLVACVAKTVFLTGYFFDPAVFLCPVLMYVLLDDTSIFCSFPVLPIYRSVDGNGELSPSLCQPTYVFSISNISFYFCACSVGSRISA